MMNNIEEILGKDPSELSSAELELLETEFSEWMNKTEELKARLGQHQRFQKSRQTEELRKNLDSIDARVEEERQSRLALEEELSRLRSTEANLAIESDKVTTELSGMKVNEELEKIAVLRIKADRLRNQIESVERMEQSRQVELDVILEESSRRNESGGIILEKLLNKVDELKAELERPEYHGDDITTALNSHLHELSFGKTGEAQHGLSDLLEKVSAVREARWDAKLHELEGELAELCKEREKLLQEEQSVREKRHQHQVLASKGIDFLVEVELGNAPPLHYIFQNIAQRSSNGEEEDAEEQDEAFALTQDSRLEGTMDDLVEKVQADLEQGPSRIKSMQKHLNDLENEKERAQRKLQLLCEDTRDYDGSLGRSSYPPEKAHLYDTVKDVLVSFLDEILDSVAFDRDHAKREANNALVQWQASRRMLIEQFEEQQKENVIHEQWGIMIFNVISSIIEGIYGELETANMLAKKISGRMILAAIYGLDQTNEGGEEEEEPSELVQEQVENTLAEMQKRRAIAHAAMKNETRIPPTKHGQKLEKPLLPQDISVFYSTNAAYSAQSINRINQELERRKKLEKEYEEELQEKRLLGAGENQEESKAGSKPGQTEDEDEDNDDERIKLVCGMIPNVDVEELDVRSSDFRAIERSFWNNVFFRSKHIQVPRAMGTPSAITFSSTGEYIAVGTGLGCILVYDLRPEKKAVLLRKYIDRARRARVSQIVWSLDAGSQLATLDEAGIVKLFSTQAPPSRKRKFAKDFKAEDLTLVLELSARNFDRPVQQDKYEDIEDIETYKKKTQNARRAKKLAAIAAKRRQEGQKEYLESLDPVHIAFHTSHTLFGVQTSLMIALWNGTIVKWNIDHVQGNRSVHCPVHATTEPVNPQNPDFRPGTPRPKAQLFGSTICREFFQDHMHPVCFMGFVHWGSELFYTLDRKMKLTLWSYTPQHFSGFGWYTPMERFSLDLSSVAFNADKSVNVEEVFPPPGVELPLKGNDGGGKGKGKKDLRPEDELLMADTEFMRLQEEEKQSLEAMDLHSSPWLTKTVGNKGRYMQIFAPRKFKEGKSSPHQVLIFSKGGVLLKRIISFFSPVVFRGRLVDVCLSVSGSELLLLVQYPDSKEKGPTLKVFVYDMRRLALVEQALELDLLGKVFPKFAVSPVIGDVGSDYLYVLMENEIHVLSMTSGEYVCQKLCPIKNEPKVRLTDLQVARNHEHIGAIGVNSDTVYLFAIENRNEEGAISSPKAQDYRPRMVNSARECDI